ncbi:MAG: branched-chain amino acid ABC transporter permease [Burkholderiales bacterium]
MTLQLALQGLAIGLVNGVLYVLTALGLTLIYGILHIVNFAHGEIFMLGAMAVYLLYVVAKLPLWLALIAIVALAFASGLAIERAFFRRLRGQWLQLVVASVGISLVIQSLAWIVFGAQEKNVPSVFPGVVSAFGVRMPIERLAAAGVALVLVAGLYWLVHRTKAGLAMRAMEEDEETARMLGVDADRVAALAVGLGFILAALGGAFVAPIYSLNPGMGIESIIMCFIIVIIGGLGSITGTLLAGLLIGVLQSMGALAFGAEAAHILVFVAMIAVLIFRPAGLLGKA